MRFCEKGLQEERHRFGADLLLSPEGRDPVDPDPDVGDVVRHYENPERACIAKKKCGRIQEALTTKIVNTCPCHLRHYLRHN